MILRDHATGAVIENLAVVYPSARVVHNHAQRPRLSG